MSAPSLSDRLALIAAGPSLVGYPVVARLVVGELETEFGNQTSKTGSLLSIYP